MKINYKRLTAYAKAPKVATAGSAGADISSAFDVTIKPGETKLIHTGLVMAIPYGHVGLMFPRSGLSLKTPLRQPNSVGVIDSDYRGEVRGMFTNTGSEDVEINRGDRIAQMIILPIPGVEWVEVAELGETDRGEGGFGSTGR